MPAQPFVCRCCRPGQTLAQSASFPMAPASFPEIESPSLRKSGVVLESEELRPSSIGQTSRDVGHATSLLNDEYFLDCDWRTENITFRERGQPRLRTSLLQRFLAFFKIVLTRVRIQAGKSPVGLL